MVVLVFLAVVELLFVTVLLVLLVLIALLWSQLEPALLIAVMAHALLHSLANVPLAGLEQHATSLYAQDMLKTRPPTATGTACARQTRYRCALVARAGRERIVERASVWQITAQTVGLAQRQDPL